LRFRRNGLNFDLDEIMDKRILVVDDDEMILKLISAVLSLLDVEVITATNGADAIKIMETDPPPLVITDWDMPIMTGPELCKKIRAMTNIGFVIIFVLTGATEQSNLVEAMSAGADDFITKPIVREKFLARVRAAQRQISMQEDLEIKSEAALHSEQLKREMKAMDQVLAVVSHELRTPLGAVRMLLESLSSINCKSGNGKLMIQKAHSQIVHMSEMVDNLLEAARLNSGKAQWNWGEVNFDDICDLVSDTVTPHLGPGVKLDLSVVPPPFMLGDEEAIRRLILNLVANAARHTKSGKIELQICPASGDRVEIRIIDTGAGIPPEILARLGNAFELNHGMVGSNHGHGTGLGIAISKHLAAIHGGTLSFQSTVGKGTSIIIGLKTNLTEPVQVSDSIMGAHSRAA
jgi:two-component system, sensor histidine kinase and response regulator